MDIDKINSINNFLNGYLWMYFELCSMTGGNVEMFGSLDIAEEDKIKIIFHQPYMILSTIFFIYEGGGNFISLIEGDQLAQFHKKYDIPEGYHIYRMNYTDINGDMYIIAKEIEVEILNTFGWVSS